MRNMLARTGIWPSVLLVLVLLAAGTLIGAQVRTALSIRRQFQVLPAQLEELGYRFRLRERQREALEAEIQQLRARLTEYEAATAAHQARATSLNERLQGLKGLAGVVPVSGPGVIVEMEDSTRPRRQGENPNEAILHNYDVAVVAGELWAAGAEAMTINGQRVVATTAIRSVATAMMVNAKRISPPLRIEAIGDPDRLAAYLQRRGGYLGLLKAYTFPVRVSRAARLTLPAYSGALRVSYLRPAGDKSR